jgi:hypothetical protein
LDVGSNQATEQPPFIGANFVPIADNGDCGELTFAGTATGMVAAVHWSSLWSLSQTHFARLLKILLR